MVLSGENLAHEDTITSFGAFSWPHDTDVTMRLLRSSGANCLERWWGSSPVGVYERPNDPDPLPPETTSLELFTHSTAEHPLLTPEGERVLFNMYDNAKHSAGWHDMINAAWARNKIINANYRLVVTIARSFANNSQELADLILPGNMGLMTAVDRYTLSKNARFSTYAYPTIKGSITDYIGRYAYPTALPKGQESHYSFVYIDDLPDDTLMLGTQESVEDKAVRNVEHGVFPVLLALKATLGEDFDILVAKYFKGLTYHEIAERHDLSKGAVEHKLERG